MLWIEERRNEAIPECLYYEGWETDRNASSQTPLMMWINYRHRGDIP